MTNKQKANEVTGMAEDRRLRDKRQALGHPFVAGHDTRCAHWFHWVGGNQLCGLKENHPYHTKPQDAPTHAPDGWTPITIPSRQDIKAARLVDGKVLFQCYNKALCEPYTLLDASLVGQDVLMYLEASYWQQRCFAMEKERDEFERKGKDLCSAYGESLIKVADLEAELKAQKGVAE